MGRDPETMLAVLGADGPAPEHAAELTLYGRFVGAWDGHVTVHRTDGTSRRETCEVYFGWVLEGRAIQDVWIAPARGDRLDPDRDTSRDMYGTTLRVYVPERDVWSVTWIDPSSSCPRSMEGDAVGDDIVQEFRDGAAVWQWRFTDISDDSFRWIAQESHDEGATWRISNEFRLTRRRDLTAEASAACPTCASSGRREPDSDGSA